jgi:hypothetical protein
VFVFSASWGMTKIVSSKVLPALASMGTGSKLPNNPPVGDPLFFSKRMMVSNPVTISVIEEKGKDVYVRMYAGRQPISPIMLYPKIEFDDRKLTVLDLNSQIILGAASVATTSAEIQEIDKELVSAGELTAVGGNVCLKVRNTAALYSFMNNPRTNPFPGYMVLCNIIEKSGPVKEVSSQSATVIASLRGEDMNKPVILGANTSSDQYKKIDCEREIERLKAAKASKDKVKAEMQESNKKKNTTSEQQYVNAMMNISPQQMLNDYFDRHLDARIACRDDKKALDKIDKIGY